MGMMGRPLVNQQQLDAETAARQNTDTALDQKNAQQDQGLADNAAGDAADKLAQAQRDSGQDALAAGTAQALTNEIARAKGNEDTNTANDSARALVQKTTDERQDADSLRQDNSLAGLATRLSTVELNKSKVIDLMIGVAFTPTLLANAAQTLTITFPRAVLDATWTIEFFSIGGVSLGSITYTETLNARTAQVSTVVLKSPLAVLVTGQVLAFATKRSTN